MITKFFCIYILALRYFDIFGLLGAVLLYFEHVYGTATGFEMHAIRAALRESEFRNLDRFFQCYFFSSSSVGTRSIGCDGSWRFWRPPLTTIRPCIFVGVYLIFITQAHCDVQKSLPEDSDDRPIESFIQSRLVYNLSANYQAVKKLNVDWLNKTEKLCIKTELKK